MSETSSGTYKETVMIEEHDDKNLVKARLLFALAKKARDRARMAEDDEGKRSAYQEKAAHLSELIRSGQCIVSFTEDGCKGDTVAVRLPDSPYHLHVPLSHLSSEALQVLWGESESAA